MIDYGYGVALDTMDKAPMAREWRNKKAVYDNCRQVGLIDETHHQKWLQSVADSDKCHMFSVTVFDKYDGAGWAEACIGVAGLTGISRDHGTAEISLYIDTDAITALAIRKDGRIAPRIIKTLACYAFLDLRLNRIFGDTFAHNLVELANLDECGFVREGVLRQSYWKGGRFIDSVIHSLLRSEFEDRRKSW